MSPRGRRRGRPRKANPEPEPEEAECAGPIMCERKAKIKKNEFECFKVTDDDDDAEYLESKLCFSVNQPITLIGIRFAAELQQNPKDSQLCSRKSSSCYDEEAFISVLDGHRELASIHIDDEVEYKSIVETTFNTPVSLEKDKKYLVKVLCNVDGAYPMAVCSKSEVKNGVAFKFFPEKSLRDGIIRGFIFNKTS